MIRLDDTVSLVQHCHTDNDDQVDSTRYSNISLHNLKPLPSPYLTIFFSRGMALCSKWGKLVSSALLLVPAIFPRWRTLKPEALWNVFQCDMYNDLEETSSSWCYNVDSLSVHPVWLEMSSYILVKLPTLLKLSYKFYHIVGRCGALFNKMAILEINRLNRDKIESNVLVWHLSSRVVGSL